MKGGKITGQLKDLGERKSKRFKPGVKTGESSVLQLNRICLGGRVL